MIWDKESNGLFIVKSAYKLARDIRKAPVEGAESSGAREEGKIMWRRVWKLPIKRKLKHFLWKCLHN